VVPSVEHVLARLERGCSEAEASDIFDSLPTVAAEDLSARWRGAEVRTGHPLEGLLERYGWYGKEFVDRETVHPLLFQAPSGHVFPVDPRKVPLRFAEHLPRAAFMRTAISLARSVVGTSKPHARLRNVEHRGRVSAAMIYDDLPIIDLFRRIDDDTLFGLMDRRGDTHTFYFMLRRDR
jgi:hypothetical protein